MKFELEKKVNRRFDSMTGEPKEDVTYYVNVIEPEGFPGGSAWLILNSLVGVFDASPEEIASRIAGALSTLPVKKPAASQVAS